MIWKITSSSKTERIDVDGHTVDVVRSKQARRLRLAVDPRNGRVRLTVPRGVALREGVKWAHDHAQWIARESGKLPAAQPIEPGMALVVAGEPLNLDWSPEYSRVLKRVGDRLHVGGDRDGLSARVLRWLKREALRVLATETQEIAARAGVVVPKVGIGDPTSRWGSCAASGTIRYSWRLILAPTDVRRATVAHEVAHRVHMNHGRAFHALVAELHGADPTPARHWLKAHGSALHWFGKESTG